MSSKKKPKKPATSAAIELPTAEPQTVAAVLEKSPIAAIIAEHEAKAPEPQAEAVAAFQRQREREQAVTEPTGKLSHADRILAERPAFRQAPEEYSRVASHEREGIRVFKNTIIRGGQKIGVAGIQFAENRQPTREEKDFLLDEGFRYKIEENLWKREGRPGEPLGDNTIDAVRKAAELARDREGLGR